MEDILKDGPGKDKKYSKLRVTAWVKTELENQRAWAENNEVVCYVHDLNTG